MLLVVLNYIKCESLTVTQYSYRAQRADEAATEVLVCVEQPRHNNWLMDSSALQSHCEAIIPAQVSWSQSSVNHGVILCVHTLDSNKLGPLINSEIAIKFIFPSCSMLNWLHVRPTLWVIVCFFRFSARGHPWPACTHILFLSTCPHPVFLCPLIFSSPLTFNLSHSWGLMTADLFSWATSQPPTVTVQLSP